MASPPPSSLSLQSSKAVQGLTGLRNLGNTVSVSPACGTSVPLSLHLAPKPLTLTLAAPCTPLPMVLPGEGFPLLLGASSPPAPGVPLPPRACLPLLRVAMVFSSASPSAS